MYKVLIVDDEPLILEGLSDLIRWEEYGLEIAGQALNGVEAVRILKDTKIHILVTDIRMPKMNGLELIKYVKDNSLSTKCIVLSGYNDFEYVRDAAVLGIENYLLKPVNEKELIPTLVNAVNRMEGELYKKIEAQEGIKILRDNVLLRWVSGDIEQKDLRERASILNLDVTSEQFMIAVVKIFDDPIETSSFKKTDKGLMRFATNNICSQIVSEAGLGTSFCDLSGDIVILLQGTSEMLDTAVVRKTLADCVHNISTLLRLNVFVTVGNFEGDYHTLYKSYNNAKKIQDYSLVSGNNEIIFYEDILHSSRKRQKDFQIDYKRLNASIANKDKISAGENIEDIFKEVRNLRIPDPACIQDVGIEILINIISNIKLLNINVSNVFDNLKYLFTSVNEFKTPEEFKNWLVDIVYKCFDALDAEEDKISTVIRKVLEYVKLNYSNEINLKTVAAKFYMNPFYLGQLFNKETGMNFNSYLNTIRIEKAKEMLLKGTFKANEIALRVGYSNPNYFFTVFKKVTGMSPSEFKIE